MKQVFKAPSLIQCDILKSMLEGEGIDCVIKNECVSSVSVYALPDPNLPSLAWSWPEVWVSDEDAERASEIAADFDEAQPGSAEE